ncbi:IS66 family insertion sequence element accessory protein TnpB [Ligilactobacillus agilis]|uniref:IS66 family insertion sequence element accessory protein TnpB n=1 Tax=Ligilactobacillus agilis TaxID=1601 RepID=UPI003D8071CF
MANYFGLYFYDDSLFLFCGRRNYRLKDFYWDGEGCILLYKRFDNGRLIQLRTGEEVKKLTCFTLKGLNPLAANS